MLKFKKIGSSTPNSSTTQSSHRPKLLTRLDSIQDTLKYKASYTVNKDDSDSTDAVTSSDSNTEFESPVSKLRNVTKKKLNQQKKSQLKIALKKEKNLLSSKDFYSRQQDLKAWITEIGYGEVSDMSEKKLKEHFKKFVSKWNRKKLPQKYYRGVDMYSSPVLSRSSDLSNHSPSSAATELWINPSGDTSTIDDVLPTGADTSVDASPVTPTIEAPQTPCSTFSQKFATVGRSSPSQLTTKLPLSDSRNCSPVIPRIPELSKPTPPKTPPKPPARRVTLRTTLSSVSQHEHQVTKNINKEVDDCFTDTAIVRPRLGTEFRLKPPNMGKTVAAMMRQRTEMIVESKIDGSDDIKSNAEELNIQQDSSNTKPASLVSEETLHAETGNSADHQIIVNKDQSEVEIAESNLVTDQVVAESVADSDSSTLARQSVNSKKVESNNEVNMTPQQHSNITGSQSKPLTSLQNDFKDNLSAIDCTKDNLSAMDCTKDNLSAIDCTKDQNHRRSGEKRGISMLSHSKENTDKEATEAKRRTVWNKEVENEAEIFV